MKITNKSNQSTVASKVNQKEEKKMKKKVLQEINKVKELKFYIKNLKTAMQNSEEYLEEYDFSKFPYTEKIDLFSREDISMAALGIVCAAVFKNGNGYHYFVYNNQFMELSERAQEFIYFHELGHILLGHNDKMQDRKIKKQYRKSGKKGEVHNFEYEADFFAAKKVGKWQALYALEEIKAHLGPASKEVFNKRMEAIFLSDSLD